MAIFVEMPLALVLAILLNNSWLRVRNLYRLVLFLPVVATTAVIGIVIAILLDPAGGFVNQILLDAGLVDQPVNFLGSTSTALPTLMVDRRVEGLRDHPDLLARRAADGAEGPVRGGHDRRRGHSGGRCASSRCRWSRRSRS